MRSATFANTQRCFAIFISAAIVIFIWSANRAHGQHPPDLAREQAKKRYNFDSWAGHTKTNLTIRSIAHLAADLAARLPIQVHTPDNERAKQLSVELLESDSTSGGHLYVAICASPRDAQEVPFRGLAAHSSIPDYIMAERGSRFDVGDVCLYSTATNLPAGIVQVSGRPFIGRLYFSRGNVAVKIINNAEGGKEYLDLLSLAKEIDSLLSRRGLQDDMVPQ
ncbi:MAG: hypothetical protein WCP86_02110 [bacterium]